MDFGTADYERMITGAKAPVDYDDEQAQATAQLSFALLGVAASIERAGARIAAAIRGEDDYGL